MIALDFNRFFLTKPASDCGLAPERWAMLVSTAMVTLFRLHGWLHRSEQLQPSTQKIQKAVKLKPVHNLRTYDVHAIP